MLEDVLGLMDGIDVGTGIDVLGLEMRRPSLELAIVDGVHQGGLSHTILPEEHILVPPAEPKLGLMEQDLATVGQGKANVGQHLAAKIVLLVFGVLLLADGGLLGGRAEPVDEVVRGIVAVEGGQGAQVRPEAVLPGVGAEVIGLGEGRGQGGDVGQDLVVLAVVRRRVVGGLQLSLGVGHLVDIRVREGIAKERKRGLRRVQENHDGAFSGFVGMRGYGMQVLVTIVTTESRWQPNNQTMTKKKK